MSGAEFLAGIGTAASIIEVINTCSKIISRIRDFQQNTAFADIAPQLSLLLKDIEAINTPENKKLLDPETEEALGRVLEGCRRQLLKLDELVQSTIPAPSSSKLKRTWKGIQSFGKDTKIKEITGILSGYKSTINLHLGSRRTRDLHVRDVDTAGIKSFFEVPRLNVSNFIGRKHILERIKLASEGRQSNPAVVVLIGVGGQGKTQIALEFCRTSSYKYKAIFWIDASANNYATRGFERIAAKLDMPNLSSSNSSEKIDYVKETLRNWPEPWLLVFDNYDAPLLFHDVSSFFPTGNWANNNLILITSRYMSSGRLGTGIEVDGLTETEGIELLLSRGISISDQDLDVCKRIVKQLGNLALAIDQAAAYISTRKLSLSLFTSHYENRKEYILKHTPASLWEYRSKSNDSTHVSDGNLSVLTTWELSLDQMSDDVATRERLCSFLTQAAFFDPTNIKESFFRTSFNGTNQNRYDWSTLFVPHDTWDSFQFQDVIAGLMNMSLIQTIRITAKESKFSLHPLIKEWLQLRSDLEVRKHLTLSAISMTACSIEEQDTESIPLETRQELLGTIDCCMTNSQQYIQNVDDRIKYAGFIEGFQTTFATFYGQHDRYHDAMELFQKALDCPWGNPRAKLSAAVELRTMNNLCIIYLYTKQLDQARDMLERTLRAKEQLLGPDNPLTLNTINNIGNLYGMQGQFEEAKSMYRKALIGYTKSYGSEHKTVVHATSNLGEIFLKLGDFEDAERYFKAALETSKKLSSVENALVFYISSNLALVYMLQGRYPESIRVYKEVIAGREALFGQEHSSTLLAKCELGDTLAAAGQIKEAEQYYEGGKASQERRQRGLGMTSIPSDQRTRLSPSEKCSVESLQNLSLIDTLKWDGPIENLAQGPRTGRLASIGYRGAPSSTVQEDNKPSLARDPTNALPSRIIARAGLGIQQMVPAYNNVKRLKTFSTQEEHHDEIERYGYAQPQAMPSYRSMDASTSPASTPIGSSGLKYPENDQNTYSRPTSHQAATPYHTNSIMNQSPSGYSRDRTGISSYQQVSNYSIPIDRFGISRSQRVSVYPHPIDRIGISRPQQPQNYPHPRDRIGISAGQQPQNYPHPRDRIGISVGQQVSGYPYHEDRIGIVVNNPCNPEDDVELPATNYSENRGRSPTSNLVDDRIGIIIDRGVESPPRDGPEGEESYSSSYSDRNGWLHVQSAQSYMQLQLDSGSYNRYSSRSTANTSLPTPYVYDSKPSGESKAPSTTRPPSSSAKEKDG